MWIQIAWGVHAEWSDKIVASIAALTALALVTAACGSSSSTSSTTSTSSSSAASGTPIKIALITSLTGLAASEFQTSPQGFLARIDLQNAEGGINGHKIDPIVIDDQTSFTTVVTATKQAIADGAIGIVNDSSLFFTAAKYPQEAGIPVTGGSFDGLEWGEQPYTNMFSADQGSFNSTVPVNYLTGKFLKAHGGTVLGSYGFGVSPSSLYAANGATKSALCTGITNGVLDTTVPFGSVNFSTEALDAKSAGVDALSGSMTNASNFALVTALKQAGVKLKVVDFPTGYEADIIGTPAWQEVQGDYFATTFRPMSLPNAGTIQMQNALLKYQGRKISDFPSFNVYESWVGTDLMIQGIKLAGPNPTSAKVITALHTVNSYNADGIVPISYGYSTASFGKCQSTLCEWFMKVEPQGFVAASATPTCDSYAPGSTSVTSL